MKVSLWEWLTEMILIKLIDDTVGGTILWLGILDCVNEEFITCCSLNVEAMWPDALSSWSFDFQDKVDCSLVTPNNASPSLLLSHVLILHKKKTLRQLWIPISQSHFAIQTIKPRPFNIWLLLVVSGQGSYKEALIVSICMQDESCLVEFASITIRNYKKGEIQGEVKAFLAMLLDWWKTGETPGLVLLLTSRLPGCHQSFL